MQKKLIKPTPKQQVFIDIISKQDLPDFVARKIRYMQGKTHLNGPFSRSHCNNCIDIIEEAYIEYRNGREK